MVTIYDPVTLKRKCNIAHVTSIQYTQRFYDVGSFEVHIPPGEENQRYLQINNLLAYNDFCGIILYIKPKPYDIEIRGTDLKGLCAQRQVIPPFVYEVTPQVISSYDRISGNAETVMKHYADKHLMNPTDTDRKVQKFTIAENKNRGKDMAWQAKFTLLSDELAKIGNYAELGYDIKLQNGMYVFDVLQGQDRRKKAGYMGEVMFSEDFRTLNNWEYTNDSLSAYNIVYTAGSGEEEEQYITEIYDTNYQGISRREGFTTVSSDSPEYVDEVRDGGRAYLKDNAVKESITGETNDRLIYGKDWALGDYVTLKIHALGGELLIDKQITEVKQAYEKGISKITPTFGEVKDSVIKKIMKG